ncbi:hypothetical protein HHI36_018498, partial [Cryptolaemus montrouzieri]
FENMEENVPFIICKPKNNQDVSITKKYIESRINSKQVAADIKPMKHWGKGCIMVKCDSVKSNEIMKREMERQLSNKCDIKLTKLRNPCNTVSNINKNIEKGEIIELIKGQNKFLDERNQIELLALKPTKKKEFHKRYTGM